MNRSPIRQHDGRIASVQLLWLGMVLAIGGGCHGGKSANPFATGATRVPPPATRSVQTPSSGYYQNPAGGTGAPAPIGTGVTGSNAAPTNWSSNPAAVGSAGSNGVYTSWLERTDSGYTVRSSANSPPASGAPAASPASPAPTNNSPSFPKTQLQTSGNSWLEPASGVNPASFNESATPMAPPPANANLQWRTTR